MKSQDFTVIVNDTYEFDNLDANSLDIIESEGKGHFHILQGPKSYRAELVDSNFDQKKCSVKINGNLYLLEFKDPLDVLVKKLGLAAVSDQAVKEVHAPMPGLVLDIQVKAGDTVEKGMPLLILEAMKMENVIKSPGDGVIKSVAVEKGAAVEKSALLVEFE
jgi:biotin carboxyl carrier protein